MKKWLPVWFLFLGIGLAGQELHRLKIEPLDLTAGSGLDFPAGIDQIASVGDEIYLRSKRDSYITVINSRGQILRNIGREGRGPGEFSRGIRAMAVFGDRLFAVSGGDPNRLLHFQAGAYKGSFPLPGVPVSFLSSTTANPFAVTPDRVVFPTHPSRNCLAVTYDAKSREETVGDLVFGRGAQDRLEKIPGINDTLWAYGPPDTFFAALRYLPMIIVYDAEFREKARFRLENPRLALIQEDLEARDYSRSIAPFTLFRDIEFRWGSVFLWAPKTLVQVDALRGTIRAMYSFYGEGPEFEHVAPGGDLNFQTFTLLDGGRVVLAPGYLWHHDLWVAQLPKASLADWE